MKDKSAIRAFMTRLHQPAPLWAIAVLAVGIIAVAGQSAREAERLSETRRSVAALESLAYSNGSIPAELLPDERQSCRMGWIDRLRAFAVGSDPCSEEAEPSFDARAACATAWGRWRHGSAVCGLR